MMLLKTLFFIYHKTTNPIHVRDSIDIQRIMVICLVGCFSSNVFWNVQHWQSNSRVLNACWSANTNDWHHVIINLVGYSQ